MFCQSYTDRNHIFSCFQPAANTVYEMAVFFAPFVGTLLFLGVLQPPVDHWHSVKTLVGLYRVTRLDTVYLQTDIKMGSYPFVLADKNCFIELRNNVFTCILNIFFLSLNRRKKV